MEQYNNQSLFDLSFTENAKTQLKSAAVWAGIAAIVGLVSTILSFGSSIVQVVFPGRQSNFESLGDNTLAAASSGENLFSAIFTLAIGILLFYFLNRFASLTKTGLSGNNQQLVTNGFKGLASYFKTIGILLIIVLVLGLLAVAIGSARMGA